MIEQYFKIPTLLGSSAPNGSSGRRLASGGVGIAEARALASMRITCREQATKHGYNHVRSCDFWG